MDIKKKLLKLLEKRVYNAEELVEEIDKLYKQDKALQLQQTDVSSCCDMSVCMKLPKCSKQCKDCNSVQ